jgi:hypothetical protein
MLSASQLSRNLLPVLKYYTSIFKGMIRSSSGLACTNIVKERRDTAACHHRVRQKKRCCCTIVHQGDCRRNALPPSRGEAMSTPHNNDITTSRSSETLCFVRHRRLCVFVYVKATRNPFNGPLGRYSACTAYFRSVAKGLHRLEERRREESDGSSPRPVMHGCSAQHNTPNGRFHCMTVTP